MSAQCTLSAPGMDADRASTHDVAAVLLQWFDRHGRHDLPWQHPRSAYRVWVSEIMLQQTQVQVVLGYFERFMQQLPTLPLLAAASEDQVMALWSGLGYYSRARNLHRAARICVHQHGGELPLDMDALEALPGIGRSTAGAILAQAHGQRVAILDANVRRVLARLHGVEGWPGSAAVQRRLWAIAEAQLPRERLVDYTQALMDFGATLCRHAAPACAACPLQRRCVAAREQRVASLPSPRTARARPTRECVMLVVLQGDRALLMRRPRAGVWAGLWSLPEAPDATAARRWLGSRLACADGQLPTAEPLPGFRHSFSHYHLQVAPLRCRVPTSIQATNSAAMQWGAEANGASGNDATGNDAIGDAASCEHGIAEAVAEEVPLRWVTSAQLDGVGLPAPVRRLLVKALQ